VEGRLHQPALAQVEAAFCKRQAISQAGAQLLMLPAFGECVRLAEEHLPDQGRIVDHENLGGAGSDRDDITVSAQ
jgi:hypothetical protein